MLIECGLKIGDFPEKSQFNPVTGRTVGRFLT